MKYSVQPGRNTNNEAHAHLLGNARQLHEFHANPSPTFTPYNSQSVLLGTQFTLPKSTVTTRYCYSKWGTPFARTAPSWKHAFPGTPGMHTIELMIHNRNTDHKNTIFT